MAFAMEEAEMMDTSCSADCPPKIRATFCLAFNAFRLSGPGIVDGARPSIGQHVRYRARVDDEHVLPLGYRPLVGMPVDEEVDPSRRRRYGYPRVSRSSTMPRTW